MAEALHVLGHLILEEQVLRQAVQGSHRLGHGFRSLQPGGHSVVGQLGVVMHYRPVDVRVHQGAVRGNGHIHHHCKAVLFQVQRGEVGGKLQGEHGEDLGGGVDGGGVGLCIPVDGRVLMDQAVYVRHCYSDPGISVLEGLGHGELIQVL